MKELLLNYKRNNAFCSSKGEDNFTDKKGKVACLITRQDSGLTPHS